jgi:hydrogenase nickel incorporation protein HypB
MCETCGCGKPVEFKIYDPSHDHDHSHDHTHNHEYPHDHEHNHDHEHSHDHEHEHDAWHSHEHDHDHYNNQSDKRLIDLNIDILSENDRLAQLNRRFFEGRKVLCLNMVSSPGSGKTSILEKTIAALKATHKMSVIEGDQQTPIDANRIEKAGAPAIQINTGSGCHLDARMIDSALKKLDVDAGSILFVENVGNLVCPAMFDLGEFKRVVVISVTEGDDKPLKYPYMFMSSQLCIINKSDLLPWVDFNTEETMKHAHSLNPGLEFIVLSAKTGEGMDLWYDWLARQARSVISPEKV